MKKSALVSVWDPFMYLLSMYLLFDDEVEDELELEEGERKDKNEEGDGLDGGEGRMGDKD